MTPYLRALSWSVTNENLLKWQENVYREDAKDAKDSEIKRICLVLVFLATFAPWRFKGFISGLSG
jgi:hypothetical protein